MTISRNGACPCGSGRKYKRCCLAARQRAQREARFVDAVGHRRIHDWSACELDAEIGAALEDYVGADRTMDDGDLQLFASWFHSDRELPSGGTPAQRYAARAGLAEDERATASRIAAARLGVHRVLSVEPGSSILLEDVLGDGRTRVSSDSVSRTAIRWDILLGRVMEGEPPTLWGAARLLEPCDEPELLAELARLAAAAGEPPVEAALSRALRAHALAAMRWVPPGRGARPSFFTLEGDPVVEASATWWIRDPGAARARLRDLGGLRPGERIEIDITVPRESLVLDLPELPPQAMVIESIPLDEPDAVPIAFVRLEGRHVRVEAMSEARLDRAIAIVEQDLGDLAEPSGRAAVPIARRLDELRATAPPSIDPLPAPAPAHERRLVGGVMTERMQRWLDEPHPSLEGRTPRQASAGARRQEVVRLVRGIENGAERARRAGQPFAEVAFIRDDLGLVDELAACAEMGVWRPPFADQRVGAGRLATSIHPGALELVTG